MAFNASFGKRSRLTLASMLVIFLRIPASAQIGSAFHRFDIHVGGGVSPTVGDISNRLNTGWHVTAGAGINFTKRFGITGEYMYNAFGVDNSVLRQLNIPDGSAWMHALTVNPVIHFSSTGPARGYLIFGPGYYHRTVEFTRPTTALVRFFDPWFGLFGTAIVPANQVIGSFSSDAFGVNAGLGATFGRSGSGTKFYLEGRYHWVNTAQRPTQMVPVTFGIRF